MREHVSLKKKPSTVILYASYWKHVRRELGNRRALDVSHADILRLHRKIGATHPVTANRVVVCLSGLFTWAATAGELPPKDNPAKRVELFREQPRERYLTDDELGRLGDALREAETIGLPHYVDETNPKAKHARKLENRHTVMSPSVVAAFRLLLFTGARLREILHLRWAEVDLGRGILFLPDSKNGKKAIVLNAPAIEVFAAQPRAGLFVIAGQAAGSDNERPRADLKGPWEALRARAGLEGLRLHDLRHTHASFGAAAGIGLPILGKLLGHRQLATTQRYAHLADDPLRRASERIGGDLANALRGAPSLNVRSLDLEQDGVGLLRRVHPTAS